MAAVVQRGAPFSCTRRGRHVHTNFVRYELRRGFYDIITTAEWDAELDMNDVQLLLQRGQQMRAMRQATATESRLYHDMSVANGLFADPSRVVSSTSTTTSAASGSMRGARRARERRARRDDSERGHMSSQHSFVESGYVTTPMLAEREWIPMPEEEASRATERDMLDIRLQALKQRSGSQPGKRGPDRQRRVRVVKAESKSYLACIQPCPLPPYLASFATNACTATTPLEESPEPPLPCCQEDPTSDKDVSSAFAKIHVGLRNYFSPVATTSHTVLVATSGGGAPAESEKRRRPRGVHSGSSSEGRVGTSAVEQNEGGGTARQEEPCVDGNQETPPQTLSADVRYEVTASDTGGTTPGPTFSATLTVEASFSTLISEGSESVRPTSTTSGGSSRNHSTNRRESNLQSQNNGKSGANEVDESVGSNTATQSNNDGSSFQGSQNGGTEPQGQPGTDRQKLRGAEHSQTSGSFRSESYHDLDSKPEKHQPNTLINQGTDWQKLARAEDSQTSGSFHSESYHDLDSKPEKHQPNTLINQGTERQKLARAQELQTLGSLHSDSYHDLDSKPENHQPNTLINQGTEQQTRARAEYLQTSGSFHSDSYHDLDSLPENLQKNRGGGEYQRESRTIAYNRTQPYAHNEDIKDSSSATDESSVDYERENNRQTTEFIQDGNDRKHSSSADNNATLNRKTELPIKGKVRKGSSSVDDESKLSHRKHSSSADNNATLNRKTELPIKGKVRKGSSSVDDESKLSRKMTRLLQNEKVQQLKNYHGEKQSSSVGSTVAEYSSESLTSAWKESFKWKVSPENSVPLPITDDKSQHTKGQDKKEPSCPTKTSSATTQITSMRSTGVTFHGVPSGPSEAQPVSACGSLGVTGTQTGYQPWFSDFQKTVGIQTGVPEDMPKPLRAQMQVSSQQQSNSQQQQHGTVQHAVVYKHYQHPIIQSEQLKEENKPDGSVLSAGQISRSQQHSVQDNMTASISSRHNQMRQLASSPIPDWHFLGQHSPELHRGYQEDIKENRRSPSQGLVSGNTTTSISSRHDQMRQLVSSPIPDWHSLGQPEPHRGYQEDIKENSRSPSQVSGSGNMTTSMSSQHYPVRQLASSPLPGLDSLGSYAPKSRTGLRDEIQTITGFSLSHHDQSLPAATSPIPAALHSLGRHSPEAHIGNHAEFQQNRIVTSQYSVQGNMTTSTSSRHDPTRQLATSPLPPLLSPLRRSPELCRSNLEDIKENPIVPPQCLDTFNRKGATSSPRDHMLPLDLTLKPASPSLGHNAPEAHRGNQADVKENRLVPPQSLGQGNMTASILSHQDATGPLDLTLTASFYSRVHNPPEAHQASVRNQSGRAIVHAIKGEEGSFQGRNTPDDLGRISEGSTRGDAERRRVAFANQSKEQPPGEGRRFEETKPRYVAQVKNSGESSKEPPKDVASTTSQSSPKVMETTQSASGRHELTEALRAGEWYEQNTVASRYPQQPEGGSVGMDTREVGGKRGHLRAPVVPPVSSKKEIQCSSPESIVENTPTVIKLALQSSDRSHFLGQPAQTTSNSEQQTVKTSYKQSRKTKRRHTEVPTQKEQESSAYSDASAPEYKPQQKGKPAPSTTVSEQQTILTSCAQSIDSEQQTIKTTYTKSHKAKHRLAGDSKQKEPEPSAYSDSSVSDYLSQHRGTFAQSMSDSEQQTIKTSYKQAQNAKHSRKGELSACSDSSVSEYVSQQRGKPVPPTSDSGQQTINTSYKKSHREKHFRTEDPKQKILEPSAYSDSSVSEYVSRHTGKPAPSTSDSEQQTTYKQSHKTKHGGTGVWEQKGPEPSAYSCSNSQQQGKRRHQVCVTGTQTSLVTDSSDSSSSQNHDPVRKLKNQRSFKTQTTPTARSGKTHALSQQNHGREQDTSESRLYTTVEEEEYSEAASSTVSPEGGERDSMVAQLPTASTSASATSQNTLRSISPLPVSASSRYSTSWKSSSVQCCSTRPSVSDHSSDARGAVPSSDARGAVPSSDARGAVPSSDARGAVPSSDARGAVPSSDARGAVPSSDARGAVPSSDARGAVPSSDARGAVPSSDARGAVPSFPFHVNSVPCLVDAQGRQQVDMEAGLFRMLNILERQVHRISSNAKSTIQEMSKAKTPSEALPAAVDAAGSDGVPAHRRGCGLVSPGSISSAPSDGFQAYPGALVSPASISSAQSERDQTYRQGGVLVSPGSVSSAPSEGDQAYPRVCALLPPASISSAQSERDQAYRCGSTLVSPGSFSSALSDGDQAYRRGGALVSPGSVSSAPSDGFQAYPGALVSPASISLASSERDQAYPRVCALLSPASVSSAPSDGFQAYPGAFVSPGSFSSAPSEGDQAYRRGGALVSPGSFSSAPSEGDQAYPGALVSPGSFSLAPSEGDQAYRRGGALVSPGSFSLAPSEGDQAYPGALVSPGSVSLAPSEGDQAYRRGGAFVSPGSFSSAPSEGDQAYRRGGAFVSPGSVSSAPSEGDQAYRRGGALVSPGSFSLAPSEGDQAYRRGGALVSPGSFSLAPSEGDQAYPGALVSPGSVSLAPSEGDQAYRRGGAFVSPGSFSSAPSEGDQAYRRGGAFVSPGSVSSAPSEGDQAYRRGGAFVSPGSTSLASSGWIQSDRLGGDVVFVEEVHLETVARTSSPGTSSSSSLRRSITPTGCSTTYGEPEYVASVQSLSQRSSVGFEANPAPLFSHLTLSPTLRSVQSPGAHASVEVNSGVPRSSQAQATSSSYQTVSAVAMSSHTYIGVTEQSCLQQGSVPYLPVNLMPGVRSPHAQTTPMFYQTVSPAATSSHTDIGVTEQSHQQRGSGSFLPAESFSLAANFGVNSGRCSPREVNQRQYLNAASPSCCGGETLVKPPLGEEETAVVSVVQYLSDTLPSFSHSMLPPVHDCGGGEGPPAVSTHYLDVDVYEVPDSLHVEVSRLSPLLLPPPPAGFIDGPACLLAPPYRSATPPPHSFSGSPRRSPLVFSSGGVLAPFSGPSPVLDAATSPCPSPVSRASPCPSPMRCATPCPRQVRFSSPCPSPVPCASPCPCQMQRASPSPIHVPSASPCCSPVDRASPSSSRVPSASPSPSRVPSASPSPSPVPSMSPCPNPVRFASPSPSPVPSMSPCPNPVRFASPSPSPVPSMSPCPNPVRFASPSPSPVPSMSPCPNPVRFASPSPSPVPSMSPCSNPVDRASPSPSPVPSASPCPSPVRFVSPSFASPVCSRISCPSSVDPLTLPLRPGPVLSFSSSVPPNPPPLVPTIVCTPPPRPSPPPPPTPPPSFFNSCISSPVTFGEDPGCLSPRPSTPPSAYRAKQSREKPRSTERSSSANPSCSSDRNAAAKSSCDTAGTGSCYTAGTGSSTTSGKGSGTAQGKCSHEGKSSSADRVSSLSFQTEENSSSESGEQGFETFHMNDSRAQQPSSGTSKTAGKSFGKMRENDASHQEKPKAHKSQQDSQKAGPSKGGRPKESVTVKRKKNMTADDGSTGGANEGYFTTWLPSFLQINSPPPQRRIAGKRKNGEDDDYGSGV